jgi:anti-sigma factor RsiW
VRFGTHPQALSCHELVELVTAYLDGALPPRDRARFETHIAGCENCTAYLQQMRASIRLTGTLREESIPAEAKWHLLDTFRAWKAEA